jgi:hypothetical protein
MLNQAQHRTVVAISVLDTLFNIGVGIVSGNLLA